MNPNISAQLRSLQFSYGTWLSLGSPTVAELAADSGFNWLLIDMEHGTFGEASVLPILQAIGPRPVATIVRIPSHDPALISRVLDWGAHGIMAPHVSTAEEAQALVQATRYPPDGTRGYSRTVRAYGYGLHSPEASPAPLLFAQIECATGTKNVKSIAAVAGVDVLFVGPADLQLSLSSTPNAPHYEAALEQIIRAAKLHNRHAGILIRNVPDLEKLKKQGFTKIAISSDISILRSEFQQLASKH